MKLRLIAVRLAVTTATAGAWLVQDHPSDDGTTSVIVDGPSEDPGDELLRSTTTTVVERDGERFPTRVHPGSWRLLGVSDDERTLFVQVGFGGCTAFDHFELTETARTVHLLAVMETTEVPAPDEQEQDGGPLVACTDELRLPVEEVSLSEPLGERALLGECEGGTPTCDAFGPLPPEERIRPEP